MDDTSPSKKLSRSEQSYMLLSQIPAALVFTLLVPILHKMQEALARPDEGWLIRIVLTIVGIAMMVGSPLAGWIIDRLGLRSLAIVSSATWLVVGCSLYFVSDVRLLIGLRLIEGLAAAGGVVAGVTLLGAQRDEMRRARLAGLQVTIGTLAGSLSFAAAGLLGDIYWRYPYLLHLLALPLVAAALLMPPSAPITRVASATRTRLFRELPYPLVVLGFMSGLAMFSISTFIPYRFHEIGIDKPSLIAYATTAQALVMASVAAMFGYFRRYIAASGVFIICFLFAGIGAFLIGIFDSYAFITIALLLYGASIASLVPNIFTTLAGASSTQRGRFSGIVKGVYFSAAFAGGLAFEPVMQSSGADGVMLLLGAVLITCAILVAITDRFKLFVSNISTNSLENP